MEIDKNALEHPAMPIENITSAYEYNETTRQLVVISIRHFFLQSLWQNITGSFDSDHVHDICSQLKLIITVKSISLIHLF